MKLRILVFLLSILLASPVSAGSTMQVSGTETGVSTLVEDGKMITPPITSTPEVDAARAAIARGEVEEAIAQLKLLAGNSKGAAEVLLGDLHTEGIGVSHNYSLAWDWYKRAAEEGNAEGQYKLATLYVQSLGVPLNPKKARRWLLMAAEQGHSEARAALQRLGIKLPTIKATPSEDEEQMAKAQDDGVGNKQDARPNNLPRFDVLLEGMEPPTETVDPAISALVESFTATLANNDLDAIKELAALEYRACATDQNSSDYDGYLSEILEIDIAPPDKTSLGTLQPGAPLPFADLVSYPVPPTHYVKMDMQNPPTEAGAADIQYGDTILQYVTNRDGIWSLILGCPTAEGFARMRQQKPAPEA